MAKLNKSPNFGANERTWLKVLFFFPGKNNGLQSHLLSASKFSNIRAASNKYWFTLQCTVVFFHQSGSPTLARYLTSSNYIQHHQISRTSNTCVARAVRNAIVTLVFCDSEALVVSMTERNKKSKTFGSTKSNQEQKFEWRKLKVSWVRYWWANK